MCACFDLFKHASTSTQTLTHTHTDCSTVSTFFKYFLFTEHFNVLDERKTALLHNTQQCCKIKCHDLGEQQYITWLHYLDDSN